MRLLPAWLGISILLYLHYLYMHNNLPTMKIRSSALAFAVLLLALGGCSLFKGKQDINRVGKFSSKTGARYNAEDGFTVKDYRGQPTAPGLVFIEGGTFIMGRSEQDVAYAYDNRQRQVTITSFYMDETEVANVDYKEFLFHVLKDSGDTKYKALMPDTNVWVKELAYNDPYAQYYFSHEGFNMYPVVGVNWYQANEYCKWRTSYVNKQLKDKDQEAVTWPAYRLPTEAEWEYAARGGLEQELYTWEGKSLRNATGRFQANFKRGRGDYAGRSNRGGSRLTEGLNDGFMIAGPVKAFWPNDFGLYNMSGNVSEWTYDTYRLLSYEDVEDLNPARRRGKTLDIPTSEEPNLEPGVAKRATLLYNPDAKGKSGGLYSPEPGQPAGSDYDNVKVYRGGSWADPAYFLTVGARRFLAADSATATVGFRCAMIRVGSPS